MEKDQKSRSRAISGLRDVSGTTIALTSLAILGAAGLVTAPLWLWYRRKRKRADALAHHPAPTATSVEAANESAPQSRNEPSERE